ncbi:HTTM domain-containing protein [Mesonia sp.]|uniref:HTTM domain-containing protein n=1 Tax=Mesonia sp. TaxID=1960830 RepID=UPI00176B1EAD|nr:HTTM domain-containing protein [Mesonia sp.]HIB36824.1 HTTM domain-containing protein [Mesonia sp.]HIO26447.1 HTTM domain-containing protein [Flavobacteriaceae bacterium]
MLNKLLFQKVDNSSLIVFRVMFGFLITLEAWGAIFTGWIKRTLIEPQFTFNFIGLDFIQPLPGNGMYFYYALMGFFGVLVMIGYKYKWSMSAFTLMWTCTYLMQKSSYNNHYYLLILICLFMLMVPANRYASVDVKINPSFKKIAMPRWVLLFIILQLWIVYTYASVAKLYPDWLDGTVPELLMKRKKDYWLVGEILQQKWTHTCILYFGILFDLLVVPLMLYRKTRLPVFIAAIFFHLFNSYVFRIGIFPYLSLAFCLFFFSAELIHRRFLWNKPFYDLKEIETPKYANFLKGFFFVWFVLQISLPLRHWLIKGDVLWTEEGHRMSWRMMLRSKSGIASYKIVNKTTGEVSFVKKRDYLTKKQLGPAATKPDVIWQFSQRLKEIYAEKGEEIEIYVNARVSVNYKERKQLIDPKVNMAEAEWDYFFHNDWILLHEDED